MVFERIAACATAFAMGMAVFAGSVLFVGSLSGQDAEAPRGANVGQSPSADAAGETESPGAGPTVGPERAQSFLEEIGGSEWGVDYQIKVFGENQKARVFFKSFALELHDDFRWAIFRYRPGEEQIGRTAWAIPIRIEIWGDVTDVYRDRDARMGVEVRPDGRFHLWVAARLHDEFTEEVFRLELVRAFVVEQMLAPYATQPSAFSGEAVNPPEWLVHGFDALLEHRRVGRPSTYYAGIVKSGRLLKPEQLFGVEDPEALDPVDAKIYRISAAAMVEALLDQPEGDIALRSALGDLAGRGDGDVLPILRQHFPAFRETEQGLEKWWALQVAMLGQQQRFEFLSREETEQWLDEVLMVRFDGTELEAKGKGGRKNLLERLRAQAEPEQALPPFVGTIEEFAQFKDRPGLTEKLGQCNSGLQHLQMVGFPLYRPVFSRYVDALEKIASGRTKGLEVELAEIRELRKTIGETLQQTEDYLNYFEATQAPFRSSVFDGYLSLRKKLDRKRLPSRDDRISQYLDAIEAEFR